MSGVITVVFHFISMQYLNDASRERIEDLLEQAGRDASANAPLARLAMESAGEETELCLTIWPGRRERFLGRAGTTVRPLKWLAGRVKNCLPPIWRASSRDRLESRTRPSHAIRLRPLRAPSPPPAGLSVPAAHRVHTSFERLIRIARSRSVSDSPLESQ